VSFAYFDIVVVGTLLCSTACSCVSRAEASSRRHKNDEPPTLVAKDRGLTAAAKRVHGVAGPEVDVDEDGIDDATELALAESYFPYYSLNPEDRCSRHGVLFRLTPHPDDPKKLAIWYVVLFELDCGRRGLGAHVGDDEVFGVIADPELPAPAGILAMRGISHQDAICERVSSCGSLPGCTPCSTAQRADRSYPVVFSSRNKHGNYAGQDACNHWVCDLGSCALNPAPDAPPFVNAGEPWHPLTRNLSSGSGFITAESGWTEPMLRDFDPWGNAKFGNAGDVAEDMTDSSFLISPSGCGE
jgi:hypothetical protein